jgi:hypothetical protein
MRTEAATSSGTPHLIEPAVLMRGIRSDLHAPLVDVDSWDRMSRICESFPTPVQTVCFECRLGAGEDQTDLAFAILFDPSLTRLAERLRRTHHGLAPWVRFADFVEEWVRPQSGLAPRIPFLCLALDGAQSGVIAKGPCVSLCVDPWFFARQMGLELPGPDDLPGLAEECCARLTGNALPAKATERLRSVVEGASSVRVKHLSLMLPRADAPMKLDLSIHSAEVGDFLKRIGWPGSSADLQSAVTEWVPWGGRVQLNLTLHPELAPPLEVEVFTDTPPTPEERVGFLDRMVAFGLAAPAKASRLRDLWRHPIIELALADRRSVRCSWYIKLRFAASGAADAKAYLTLMPREVRGSLA